MDGLHEQTRISESAVEVAEHVVQHVAQQVVSPLRLMIENNVGFCLQSAGHFQFVANTIGSLLRLVKDLTFRIEMLEKLRGSSAVSLAGGECA